MAGEVTNITVTEQTLYNLTITEDDATVTTVAVPNEITTIEINAYDVNVNMVNNGTGVGVFKVKSIDQFLWRSISDDNKTIDVASANSDNEIKIKLPDAGISTPDDFTINADSDSSANIKLVGASVDLSKAKLITDLDANSKDLDSVGTITATTGAITTVNATTVNTSDLNVTDDLVVTDDLTVNGAVSIAETLGVSGDATFNENISQATGKTATIPVLSTTTATIGTGTITTADINGGAIDGTTIGSSTSSTGRFSTLESASVDINGGAIDGTPIGATTPSTIVTSNLTATTADINAGTIDNTTIGATTPSTIVTSDLTATTVDINAGTIDNTVIGATTPVAVTTSSLVATTADINAGTIDNTVIGGSTAVAGTFTTATATTGNITTVNATDVNVSDDLVVTDDASVGGDLAVTGNTVLTGNLTVNGTQTTVNTETINLADNNILINSNHTGSPTQDGGITIERGTSDDAVFQWNETTDKWEAKVGSSYADFKVADVNTTSLTATSGTITNMTSSNVDITGGTIDNVNITNIPAVSFADLTATTADINGGTIDGTVVGGSTPAAVSTTSLVATTADINAGTIDNSVIGATTPVAGTFTTATATTGAITTVNATTINTADLNVSDDLVLTDDLTVGGDVAITGNITVTGDILGLSDHTAIGTSHVIPDGQFYPNFNFNGDLSGTETFTTALTSITGAGNAAYVGDMDLGFNRRASDDANLGYHGMWRYGMIDEVLTRKLTAIDNGNNITVTANLIPDGDKTRSLGSASKQWKDLYVGPGTLFIDGHPVLGSSASGTINISTDTGQTLDILAGGATGTAGAVNIASRSNVTNLNDTTVNLGPSTSGGTINARGTLEASDFHNGALEFSGTLINQTDTNQNLEIRTNGSGYLHANVADLYVGPIAGAVKIDESSISVSNTNGDLNLTSNGTGTVNIDDLEVSHYSQFGEDFGKIKATGTNQNLCLEASNGTGYFVVKSPNQYFGAASGVKITNAAGSATTLSGFGYQSEALNITGNLTGPVTGDVTGDLTGDVTGDVTGDLTGNLTADATTEKLTTKNIISNADSVTIPNVSNWGGFPMFANAGGVSSATKDSNQTGGGYPFIGIAQSTSGNTQPISQYLINNMNYDISGGVDGTGVQVRFAAQDEAGKLLDLASNLVKLRGASVSGSAGSTTVGDYNGEYTLTIFDSASGTTTDKNVLTSNKDFTEVAEELRVVNKPTGSGNTDLSGVYLTYSGAETGTPSALLQLRDKDDDENTENIKLEQDRTTFGTVIKQHTSSSDPSGENGDMYYNTTSHKFRGYANGSWVDLH